MRLLKHEILWLRLDGDSTDGFIGYPIESRLHLDYIQIQIMSL